MVDALSEAHRVLRRNGMLVDLRPAAKHRRVGLQEGRHWRQIGVMRETFEEDWAADRAVASIVRGGLFRIERKDPFVLDRVMDTVDDLREWISEFGKRRALASHAWLIRRVERALESGERKIVGRGPVVLQQMRRLG